MKLSLTIQTPEVKRTVPVSLLSGTFEEKIVKGARLHPKNESLLEEQDRPQDVEMKRWDHPPDKLR